MSFCFSPADILLPQNGTDLQKFACIACDQFTSEPRFWEETDAFVGGAPSALRMILPELYLANVTDDTIARIHRTMVDYQNTVLQEYKDALIYVERHTSSGIRRGIVGKIDLEAYDYNKGSTSPVRATEGTVLSRIPPRIRVRRGASLELPHVMILFNDPEMTVLTPLANAKREMLPAYNFDLMQHAGHIEGYFLSDAQKKAVLSALEQTAGDLQLAVGDGNHSLATAKAYYEELKVALGDKALTHPARYALAELVNVHDPALVFEPIYRVVFGADVHDLLTELQAFLSAGKPKEKEISVLFRQNGKTVSQKVDVPSGFHTLTVGTLQAFLDGYTAGHPEVTLDYIHGKDSVLSLVEEKNGIGFLFDGIKKEDLFPAVAKNGALPRKTFSMGEALDKRFYLECRSIL